MSEKQLKVLIVDDSPVAQSLLSFIIESDPHLKVMAIAKNGEETLEILKKETPDVITMDIVMPKMDGFEVTRKILKQWTIPIIVISEYYGRQDVEKCFRAMDAGALAILEKPKGLKDPHHLEMAKSIIETIKVMANVKIHRREPKQSSFNAGAAKRSTSTRALAIDEELLSSKIEAVGIGASVGGPQAISKILSDLSPDFPAPIFIVQHMSGGFTDGFIDWLKSTSTLPVQIAKNDEKALNGHVYVAPEHFHLEIAKGGIIKLIDAPPEKGFKPSISRLFRSMAQTYGAASAGIILSGMGSDGVQDLLIMKNQGALTIVQNEESSVMFGKQSEAIRIGAVKAVLPLAHIPLLLEKITHYHPTH